jgi:hypothetical protein
VHEDHCKPLREVRATTEAELTDAELENVVGGVSAQKLHANTQRIDPYKTFRF